MLGHGRDGRGTSEIKSNLQIDSPVGGVAGEETAGQGVGSAEDGGIQIPLWRGVIDVIEDIARGNAKGEVVPAVRSIPFIIKHILITHAAESTRAKSVAPTPTSSTPWAATLNFSAKRERLAKSKVGRELAVAGSIINWDDRLTGHGHPVKVSPA
jgi:hypothetical protein